MPDPAIGQEWFSKHVFVDLQGWLFYLALVGVIVLCVVMFFVLNALPPPARRRLIVVTTFLAGLYYALEFFIPAKGIWLFGRFPLFASNPLTGYFQPLAQFLRVLGGFAIGLGLISLFTVHGHRIARQRAGWGNSVAFFVAFAAITVFGLWQHFDTGEPPAPTPHLLPPTTYEAEPLIEAAFDLTPRQKAELKELPERTMESPEVATVRAQLANPQIAPADQERAEKTLADAQKALEDGIASILTEEQQELKRKLEDETLQATVADVLQRMEQKYGERLRLAKFEEQAAIRKEMRTETHETLMPHVTGVLTQEQRARLSAAQEAMERSRSRSQFAADTYRVLFIGMFNALDATMFAILAFFIVSAAYRAFRVRSAEATLMMVAAFIIMLGQVPIGTVMTDWIPRDSALAVLRLERLSNWILTGINAAAFRAIIFGIMMGYLAMALRMWLSLERGAYFGQD